MIRLLERLKTWHILLIAIVCSEVFTYFLSSMQGILRWGAVPKEIIEVGSVDALVVAFAVFLLVTSLIRYSSKISIEKDMLQRGLDERVRAEAALRESELKYRELVENANSIILRWYPNGEITFLNEFGQKFFGYQAEEIVGRKVSGTITPDFESTGRDLRPLMEKICENPLSFEQNVNENMRRDGSRVWIAWTNRAVMDAEGKLKEVLSIGTDITGLRKAEEALRESETRFRQVVESSPLSIALVAADGTIEYVNPKVREVTGYDVEYIPRLEYWYKRAYPDPSYRECITSRCMAYIETVALNNHPGEGVEAEITCHDGSVRTMQIFGAVMGDKFLVMLNDLTASKKVEKEKERLLEQLLQSQKMESVGRLAGGVAHDFNNLLGVIMGHCELALEDINSRERLFTHLKEIRTAAERSANLTRHLLAFARKQTIMPKVLDLNDTLEAMLKMLRRLIGEEIDLAWLPGTGLWPVLIDPSQVDQVIANLCVNARDAIAGIGKITIETKNIYFDEDFCMKNAGYAPGEYVMLSVSDTGCGMDEKTLDKLFEPFFTTKDVGYGTGLGLATVYGIISQNGGFIHVDSELNNGSVFSIYLPRFIKGPSETIENTQPALVSRGRETILLVEDEPALLEVIRTMLESLGYKVLPAAKPGEAIRCAGNYGGEIHLLITDVVMPEMNGLELMHSILPLYPRIKCLFISGYTADIIGHHGVLDEGINFIQKPLSLPDLASKVRAVVNSG